MGYIASSFVDSNITGEKLIGLDDATLTQVGVTSRMSRKRIMEGVEDLVKKSTVGLCVCLVCLGHPLNDDVHAGASFPHD